MTSFLKQIFLIFQSEQTDISEEFMEELKMESSFKPKEINRIRKFFLSITGGNEQLSLETFLGIDCISINPLKDRIALCFGYTDEIKTLDFKGFIIGLGKKCILVLINSNDKIIVISVLQFTWFKTEKTKSCFQNTRLRW